MTFVPLGSLCAPGGPEHPLFRESTRHRGLWEERGAMRGAAPPRLLLLVLRRSFIFLSPLPMQKVIKVYLMTSQGVFRV